MILVIDNYDSFTFNLVDLLLRTGAEVQVVRNDELSAQEAISLNPKGILISPGPGRPEDSLLSVELTRLMMGKIPILGVCLGHQLLGMLCGVPVVTALKPMHGKTSQVSHTGEGIFAGMPQPFRAMRYHSLILENNLEGNPLEITAWTSEGEIMGIRHKIHNFAGVQFHPESILTEDGDHILRNWLNTL